MVVTPSIATRQNDNRLLKVLAAQRHVYAQVKLARLFRLLCTLLASAGISVVIFLQPDQIVKLIAGGFGALLAITGFVLERFEPHWVKHAARLQEVFDTRLFNIPWNAVIAGSEPSPEEIEAEARSFSGNKAELHDWYGDVSGLSANTAVLLCQRTNVSWDGRSRRRYAILVAAATGLAVVMLLGVGVAHGASLLDWLLLLAVPCLSTVLYGTKVSLDNFGLTKERDSLAKAIDAAVKEALRGAPPDTTRLRQFQDQVFLLRCKTTVVPDAWHKWVRPDFQNDMSAALEEFRRQAVENSTTTGGAAT